jgi:hypothetical protein
MKEARKEGEKLSRSFTAFVYNFEFCYFQAEARPNIT